MKIYDIYIDGYKNLTNLELILEKESSMVAFIGNNGSGKSNILEALTIIFSKVRSKLPVEFNYRVEYTIDEEQYKISNMEGGSVILCNGKELSKSHILQALPGTVFLYYCGETARLKELSLDYVKKEFENITKLTNETTFKYLTYITVEDFGAALLANIAFENITCRKIFEIVQIEAIHMPIIFKFKRPEWSRSGKVENLWNATGAVRSEIEKLKDISAEYKIDNDAVEIHIRDTKAFKTKWYSALNLFMALKMLMQADILASIEFSINKKDDNEIYSYMNLSEGEKQLSQLLSLIDITKEHKALFLLDEIDSYLHPNWQRKFTDIIRSIDIKGQILFTTHSPLTLGKMYKDDIIILKDGQALYPSVDTRNRDVTEVLEEIMEVDRRPEDINKLIWNFRNAAVHGDREKALKYFEVIKTQLSKDDPFFITAEHMLANLK